MYESPSASTKLTPIVIASPSSAVKGASKVISGAPGSDIAKSAAKAKLRMAALYAPAPPAAVDSHDACAPEEVPFETKAISPSPRARSVHCAEPPLALRETSVVSAVRPVSPSRSVWPPVGVTPRMSTTPVVRLLASMMIGPGSAEPTRSTRPVPPQNVTSSALLSRLSYPVTNTRPPPITYAVRLVNVLAGAEHQVADQNTAS